MKKLMLMPFALAASLLINAQEIEDVEAAEEIVVATEAEHSTPQVWPAFLAFSQVPPNPDVVGFRITIPFSTKQDSVTGFDVGLWGHSSHFEGFQFNVLVNDVVDSCGGLQLGICNFIGAGELTGIQVGLWNEAGSFQGIQAGLFNVAGHGNGFQVGFINRAEELHGYQVGVINVIRSAELHFMPLVNIGF